MLLDRGFDVSVCSLENGERSTRNIVSTNKEDPVQSQPVGRIDYLHTDGTVRESIEYTSPYQFASDIREETYYGVPFKVVFYKDKEGNTISREFAEHLDPPAQSIEIIDSPYLAKDRADEMLRQAEHIAAENTLPPDERFFVIETDEGYAIWDDLTEAIYIDDEGVSEEFKSEWQANDYLEDVKKSVSEKEAAEWLYVEREKQNTSAEQPEQNEAEPFTPAFSQPKRSRVQTFDLHPEIPLSERHTFDLASHEVPEAGKKERFRRNMAAINVLKECEFDNRFATPEEQEILQKLNDQSRKDDVVTFEELGIDRLFIDESHYYKNLYLYTKMRNVGGIAQTEAQKSSDLFMKCRYLDEITGGRGVVFATGTPISNSMVVRP